MAARILYNLLQVIVVIVFAPLVEGVTSRLKENLQSKRGPSIFQPYRDLWKLCTKTKSSRTITGICNSTALAIATS